MGTTYVHTKKKREKTANTLKHTQLLSSPPFTPPLCDKNNEKQKNRCVRSDARWISLTYVRAPQQQKRYVLLKV